MSLKDQANLSYEQNRIQIQKAYNIINVVEDKLNQFLQKKGTEKLNNSQQFSSQENLMEKNVKRIIQIKDIITRRGENLEKEILIIQEENHQHSNENQRLQSLNDILLKQIEERKLKYQKELDQALANQRQILQQEFEENVNVYGERAKERLVLTLQKEDDLLKDYNANMREKQYIQQQIQTLEMKNRDLEQERGELAVSYHNLLQMHDQILQIDKNHNEYLISNYKQEESENHNGQNKIPVVDILNRYKFELDKLKHVNEDLQKQMNDELTQLRMELEKQKQENYDLIKEMSSLRPVDENSFKKFNNIDQTNNLYEDIFNSKNKLQEATNTISLSNNYKGQKLSDCYDQQEESLEKTTKQNKKSNQKKKQKTKALKQKSGVKKKENINNLKQEVLRLKSLISEQIDKRKKKISSK